MKITPLLFVMASWLALVLSGCSSTNGPGGSGTKQGIMGTVASSKTAGPLSGVTVTIVTKDTIRTTTDVNGKYALNNIPAGDITIRFSRLGYTTQSKVVQVDSGTTYVLNIIMKPAVTTANVEFLVRDEITGLPIDGARIYDLDYGDSLYTDQNGVGVLSIDSFGNLLPRRFRCSKEGYVTTIKTINDIQYNKTVYDTILLQNTDNHLICSYKFSESVIDSSKYHHDGTNHGCTFVADRFGKITSALQCNGGTNYISVPDATDLNFGKESDFTVCYWLKYPPSEIIGENFIINKSTTVANVFTGYKFSASEFFAICSTGTTYGQVAHGGNVIKDDGLWHFICFVITRSGTIDMYIDGKWYSAQNDFDHFLNGNINTAAELTIGGNGTAGKSFKGSIDDIKIYNVALDDASIQKIYHEDGW